MADETILLIDPDEAVGASVAGILEGEGYKVTTIRSLPLAVELLSSSRFDLVMTEAFDQRRTFDFDPAYLSALRSAAGRTPIILISTYVSTDTIRAYEYGLADAVPKPFELNDLLEKVGEVLKKAGKTVDRASQPKQK
mgnify:CR=1 FL=1